MVVRGKLRTCDTSKMVLFFAQIVCSLKPLTILAKGSILRSVTECWICLECFLDLHLLWTFFLLLTFSILMKRQLCTQMSVWQQCLSCRLDVLVNFGQIFATFSWHFYLFIVNISFQQCQWLRCPTEIFVYKLLWQRHF